jgi:hypothetical protein
MQMQVLPSVQPFHAIAYPIDAMLALEIRNISSEFERVVNHSATCSFVLSYLTTVPTLAQEAIHLKFMAEEFTIINWRCSTP